MGYRTKIDWCDTTWNPVTGCLHGCEYCYARGIAHRFGLPYAPRLGDPGMEGAAKWDSDEGMDTMLELEKPYIKDGVKQPYPMGFLPTFHRYRLDMPEKWSEPRTIFVCSMADLFGDWVPDEWIQEVFVACEAAPQHRYLFLTKNPSRYDELKNKGIITGREENFWLGSTMTGPANPFYSSGFDKTFISIEPILRPFHYAGNAPFAVSWVIVGAETGNRKDKVIPKKEWILEIAERCRALETPIFMKESLREIMGEDFTQEFPW